ncbi:DUF1631 family protein [Rhodoferax sp.]|uniref:DUF1631 family protein n=1 Tax=Rhodoferax sp. TaxID=50421 RepID=UPI0025FEC7CE|nr:DUF1631 family protein [Rhodoferax sp.]
MQDQPTHYAALYQSTLKDAAAGGPAMMGKLVATLRQALLVRESASRDFREREVHADSLKLLLAHEGTLRQGFELALMEQFTRPVAAPKAAMPSIAEVQFDQLELMDEVQVQESVNMARAQQMAMLAAEVSLAELNTLICTTLGLPTVRPERNPLRPESYINALRNTVERTPVPSATRLDWLTTMGTVLGGELKTLYTELVGRLRTQGVEAAGYAVTQSAASSGGGGRGKEVVPNDFTEASRYGAPGSAEREAMIAREARESRVSRPAVDPGLLTLDRLRKLLSGELDQMGTQHRVAAFAQQFARQFDYPHPVVSEPVEGPADFAATVPAAFEALTEMKQVDRVVQRLEQRRNAVPSPGGAQGLDAARESIRRSATGIAQALSLEVVELMVDNIARDPRLLAPVQALVRELEPALMRLALADPRLFTDKNHAARMLVQELTHRSLAYANVQSPGFLAFLDEAREAIAPLVNAAVEGPELFDEALRELQVLWAEEAAKQIPSRNQAVKALEKAEQRNLLAEKIAREIDTHPDAPQVPEVVLNFLCGPWAQVVAQARLSGGSGSAAADKYQALISALLWSTHPELAPKNIAKLTKLVPLLLATMRDGLETIQYPATKTSAFLEALMGIHQAIFKMVQTRGPVAAVKVEPPPTPAATPAPTPVRNRPVEDGNPWVAPSEAQDSNFLEIPDEAPATAPSVAATILAPMVAAPAPGTGVDSLPLGSWVELQTQGDWVRTQLTWASPHGTLFLFTSAAGNTQSMTRRTHDKLVAAGHLRVISSQTVVDGALDAVAQQAMKNSLDSTL